MSTGDIAWLSFWSFQANFFIVFINFTFLKDLNDQKDFLIKDKNLENFIAVS